MKFKEFEGTPEEIGKLCEEQNFNLTEYLRNSNVKTWVFAIVIAAFLIVCCVLWTVDMSDIFQQIMFLFALLLLGATAVVVHLKYQLWMVTMITGIVGLVMLSVAMNILTPKEAIRALDNKLEYKSD